MVATRTLHFRQLDETDIRSLLARNNVGRLAFIRDGEVDIRPLHYVYSSGKIYGRTTPEARFGQLGEHARRVVFEVDEVDSVYHWQSVIARGSFSILSHEADGEEWKRAVSPLRRVIKATLVDADPVPERSVVFCITINEATGRASG